MNKLKKVILVFVAVIGMVLIPNKVLAANAKVTIGGSSTVVIGNRLTVYVTISSGVNIGSWQMNLKYDKNYLQLTSANTEAGGTMMANSSASGVKKKTYTFTFKTLKKGNTSISISNALAYAYDDLSKLNLSTYSKPIRLITQAELEASYSKDNYLKSLSVEGYELEPAFDKDVMEYKISVPEDVKEVNINGAVNDNKSNITGVGVHAVTLGDNVFEIVVRAQNGGERVYKVNVEVKDLNPINVTIADKNYTVVKIKEQLPEKNNYNDNVIKIDDIDIPCYQNDKINVTLVALKDEDGKIDLYKYDLDKKEFSLYNEIGLNSVIVYPLDTDETLKGYTKEEVEINGSKVNAFVIDNKSRYLVVYGINIETGEKGFYMYDKENQNAMKYNDEYINKLEDKLKLYSYIIFAFSGIVVIMLLILLFGKPKKSKKKGEKVEDKKEKNIKESEEKNIIYDKPNEKKKKKTKKD